MARTFANVAAAATDSNLVTARTGQKVRVMGAAVSCGATPSAVTFNSKPAGAGSAVSCAFNNTVVLPENPNGWFETNVGEGLTATTGAGSTTGIQVSYQWVPA